MDTCAISFRKGNEAVWFVNIANDGEAVEGLIPVSNGKRPFLGRLVNGHVYDFEGRFSVGINFAVLRKFANDAVNRFDDIRGVDRLANYGREVE